MSALVSLLFGAGAIPQILSLLEMVQLPIYPMYSVHKGGVNGMKRIYVTLLILCVVLVGLPPSGNAAPQLLPELSYKFYPLRDIVFVDFYNPYFTPVGNITVNMTVREGTGRNRVVAIGQTRMPSNLVLLPGEHTSVRIPIRARVIRDIPALAQFDFRIMTTQLPESAIPPEVVVQDSSNGITLDLNHDANSVPFVMGFIGLSPVISQPTIAKVDMAILTFYDENHQILWSEFLPVNGKLGNDDSLMVWGKFEQASSFMVPGITSIEAKFVVEKSK